MEKNMSKEIELENRFSPEIEATAAQAVLSLLGIELDDDDAEMLARRLSLKELEALRYLYKGHPPVTPPPADSEIRKAQNPGEAAESHPKV